MTIMVRNYGYKIKIFMVTNRDPFSAYRSGSKWSLKTNPVWIRNTGCVRKYGTPIQDTFSIIDPDAIQSQPKLLNKCINSDRMLTTPPPWTTVLQPSTRGRSCHRYLDHFYFLPSLCKALQASLNFELLMRIVLFKTLL